VTGHVVLQMATWELRGCRLDCNVMRL